MLAMSGGGAPAAVARLPSDTGVYRFRDARGRVLYIGRASDLRRRVASYWGRLRGRGHLSRMVARVAQVEAVVCDSEHEAAWLERNLLERALPPWNRTRGAEVPVYVRLDARPGSPGLTVVHEPRDGATHFGPYLGGGQVRLAVSALNRVLPLAYARDGLGGFGRDMARVRGVASGDRAALVRGVAAALDREPATLAWLRGELARRRDAAAERLAFELAARMQAEIEALEWVVAEQKATRPEPEDLDVHGWAAGVLVHFEVRTGRLTAWHQRPCSESSAQRRVEATRPEWQPFATRNAQLAARLSHPPD